jgi:hypothetical protein
MATTQLQSLVKTDLPSGTSYHRRGRQVVLDEPVDLAAGGEVTVRAVALLRECQSHALQVQWRLREPHTSITEFNRLFCSIRGSFRSA